LENKVGDQSKAEGKSLSCCKSGLMEQVVVVVVAVVVVNAVVV